MLPFSHTFAINSKRTAANEPIEQTVKPIMGYLGVLFLCLLVIAFIPGISTALPHAFGY
jgi:TRAP-type C4-dicarboxylate transport system permease large subunit